MNLPHFFFRLLFITSAAFILVFTSACRDDDFNAANANILLNGEPWTTRVSGEYNIGTDRFSLTFASFRDDYMEQASLYISNLPPVEMNYFLNQTDVTQNLEIVIYIDHDGDSTCDVYRLTQNVTTNFLQITYASTSECIVRGAYDLTFQSERLENSNCRNPIYPEIIRLQSENFEIKIDGC